MNLIKALCVVSLGLGTLAPSGFVQAQDALVGSWVLDPAKNQGSPGMVPTAGTATVAAAGVGQFAAPSSTVVFKRK